jgi:hypothetical protein
MHRMRIAAVSWVFVSNAYLKARGALFSASRQPNLNAAHRSRHSPQQCGSPEHGRLMQRLNTAKDRLSQQLILGFHENAKGFHQEPAHYPVHKATETGSGA